MAGGYNDTGINGSSACLGETPDVVNVTFPEHVGHLPSPLGGYQSYNGYAKHVENAPSEDMPGDYTTWVIFSTAAADMTGLTLSQAPAGDRANNTSDLYALAQQIGSDFYAWLWRSYDLSVIGLWPNGCNAYEDAQVIHFGLDGQGRYQCHTRIWTLPPDVGSHANWCQGPGCTTDCCTGTGSAAQANFRWPGPKLPHRADHAPLGRRHRLGHAGLLRQRRQRDLRRQYHRRRRSNEHGRRIGPGRHRQRPRGDVCHGHLV